MKKKLVLIITNIITITGISVPVYAAGPPDLEPEPPLYFRSINAGYKNDDSTQNYDFFRLAKSVEEDLDLSEYKVQYYNGNDNLSGEIEFAESTILRSDTVVFGFEGSPQFANASSSYLYNFGSTGLAATAGRLKIVQGDEIIDEVCWGKLSCANQFKKFATSEEENKTAIRLPDASFIYEKSYPDIDEDALLIPEPEPEFEPESEPVTEPEMPSEQIQLCVGLTITEIYAYYEEKSDEQFVELYNSLDQEIILDSCAIRYKNKEYPLQGKLAPHQYLTFRGITLTKNPSTELTLEIIDGGGSVVDAAKYTHGQKAGTSYALFDGQ